MPISVAIFIIIIMWSNRARPNKYTEYHDKYIILG